MIEMNTGSQAQSLTRLQQGLKSLKVLLLSQGLSTPSTYISWATIYTWTVQVKVLHQGHPQVSMVR
jgi:hypothetical protein